MRVAIELEVSDDWTDEDVTDVLKKVLGGRVDFVPSPLYAAMIGGGRSRIRRIRVLRVVARKAVR